MSCKMGLHADGDRRLHGERNLTGNLGAILAFEEHPHFMGHSFIRLEKTSHMNKVKCGNLYVYSVN